MLHGLRWLLAPNPSPMTLDGTRTYVIGEERPVVIDPGPANRGHIDRLLELLGGRRPQAILLTHHHPDHAGAAAPLGSASGVPVLMARGALEAGFPRIAADRWIGEGEEIETDAGTVRALATPGHAPEHLAFLWTGGRAPSGGALFVGDLMMGEGETTLVAPPEGDLRAYLASLRRIAGSAAVLYPAHGPPLTDPAAAVDRYLRHRQERIEQVLAALASSPSAGPEELLEAVYGSTLDDRLRPAARASLRAILRYLLEEARVDSALAERFGLTAGATGASFDTSQ